MWGFGNSAGLRPIGSFKEAKHKYEDTTPIRGRKEDVRPLGSVRRYTDHRIVKNLKSVEEAGNPLGRWQESYSAKLYRTDCIEWFDDGSIEVGTGGWQSPTTQSFLNYTLQNRLGTFNSFNGKWYFRNYANGMDYYLDGFSKRRLRFEPTGNQVQTNGGMMEAFTVVNPVQEYRYKANRKALNALRRKYKNFIEYGKMMLLMTPQVDTDGKSWGQDVLTYSHYRREEALSNRTRMFKELDKFNESGDLEIALAMMTKIGHAFGDYKGRITSAEFVRGFAEVLKYQFNEQAFVATPVPIGEAFYDRNAKYFKQ